MKKRLETKLFSNGAEFLVMSKLLLSNIETYKAYVNFEGYDLVCANPKEGLSAKIQVKSKNFVKDVSFYLNSDDKSKSDFYVFAQTNSIKRKGDKYELISDDVLDYTAESDEQIGKNIGDDLGGGKITLPFIYAFQNSSNEKKEILRNIIQNRKIEDFMILRDIIFETNSIKLTQDKAKEYVELAKNNLKVVEDTEVGKLLNFLAEFALKRQK